MHEGTQIQHIHVMIFKHAYDNAQTFTELASHDLDDTYILSISTFVFPKLLSVVLNLRRDEHLTHHYIPSKMIKSVDHIRSKLSPLGNSF